MDLTWMAWTWPTAAFFLFIFAAWWAWGCGKSIVPAEIQDVACSDSIPPAATGYLSPWWEAPSSLWAGYGLLAHPCGELWPSSQPGDFSYSNGCDQETGMRKAFSLR